MGHEFWVRSNHGIQLTLELKTQNTHSFPPLNPHKICTNNCIPQKPNYNPNNVSNLTKIVATHTILTKKEKKVRKIQHYFTKASIVATIISKSFHCHCSLASKSHFWKLGTSLTFLWLDLFA